MKCQVIGSGPRSKVLIRSLPPDVIVVYESDVVLIAVPIDSLGEVLLEQVKLGKDVFVEKPGCSSTAKCDEIIEEVTKRRNVVRVGFSWIDAYFDHLPVKWSDLKISWLKRKSKHPDLRLNLACHPVSLLFDRIPELTGGFDWDVRRDLIVGRCSLEDRKITLTVDVDPNNDERVMFTVDGRNVSMRSTCDSAETQLRSFFHDVKIRQVWGTRDLRFARKVIASVTS